MEPTETSPASSGIATARDTSTREPAERERAVDAGKIGRFTVLRRLGEGGMGVVFACYDAELDRKIAVKLVRRAQDAGTRQRMLREAQAMARLAHPNVIPVFEVGEHAGQLYLAMEYVQGKTLREYVADERPGWRAIVAAYLDAARGLAAAHAAGLVHRDFKPDNAIRGDDGRVRVLDFGLARQDAEPATPDPHDEGDAVGESRGGMLSTPLTEHGTVVGTPVYMAPEQLLGEAVDARTDQFSFAIALWEALQGRRPFRGQDRTDLVANVTRGSIDPDADKGPWPTWVRATLRRALQPNPAERFASMQELVARLERDPARRRWKLAGYGAGGIAVVGALAIGPYLERRTRQACEQTAAVIDAVWSDDAARSVRGAFAATGADGAAAQADRVVEALGAWADAWRSERVDTCMARAERRDDTAVDHDRAVACLARRLAETETIVAVLRAADATVVQRAMTAIDDLDAPDTCTSEEWLAAEAAPPAPDIAPAVEAVRHRMLQIKVELRLRIRIEETTEPDDILGEARRVGYAPAIAEAAHLRGRVRLSSGATAGAVEDFEESYFLAGAAGHLTTATESASLLVFTLAEKLSEPVAALAWGRHAEMMLARLPRDDYRRALVASDIGSALLRAGRFEEAIAKEREAIDGFRSIEDEAPMAALPAYSRLALAAQRVGRLDEAEQAYREMLATIERDDEASDAAKISLYLGAAQVIASQDVDEAVRTLDRTSSLAERLPTPRDTLLQIDLVKASMLARVGRDDEAMRVVERARSRVAEVADEAAVTIELQAAEIALAQRDMVGLQRHLDASRAVASKITPPSATVDGRIAGWQAFADSLAGRHAEALAISDALLGDEATRFNMDARLLAIVVRARSLVASGRYAEAITAAEQAVELQDATYDSVTARGYLPYAALSRYVLARALWDGGGDRERALSLARESVRRLRTFGDYTRAEQDEVEQWIAARAP